MIAARERLNNGQIILLRSLVRRGGGRAVSIDRWRRRSAATLWRRGLIEIWYRQSPDEQPSLQGPYYSLTMNGFHLASHFFNDPAPRGLSGATEKI